MLKRITFTLTVMSALTGLYWLYALIVTPRLIPVMSANAQSHQLELEEMRATPPPGNMEDAERFLPEAPWAAQAKFQIRLAHGVMYSQSWKPIDEEQDVFEFRPFAMIWFEAPVGDDAPVDSNHQQRRPMTLIADAGLIRFSSKFDPVNQKVGRVIGGKLEGNVHGAGPDNLTVKGRDLFFLEKTMELYTDRPVEFTYQRHRGNAASGMTVELLPSNEPPRPDQLVSIGGFRRLMLRGHVEMDLATDDGELHVTCDEGFDFNHESRSAAFKDNVNVTRLTGPQEIDQLRCQYLDLFLDDANHDEQVRSRSRGDAPAVVPLVRSNTTESNSAGPTSSEAPRPKTGAATNGPAASMALRQLRATGNRVELLSSRNGLTALMTNLIYDVPSKTTVLKAAQKQMQSVTVRQPAQGHEMSCPEIVLIQDAEGQVASIAGNGLGWLKRRQPASDEIEFEARWKQRFLMQRIPNSDLDVIELHGRAVAQQPNRGTGIAADLIQLQYDRPAGNGLVATDSDPVPARGTQDVSPTVTSNESSPKSVPDRSTTSGFRPRQLQAQSNVRVVSPQMTGQSKRLIVHFEDGVIRTPTLANKTTSRSRVQPAGRKQSAGEQSKVLNLFDAPEAGANNSADNHTSNAEPLELNAELIQAKLLWFSGQSSNEPATEVSEVWTDGNVDIQQPHADGQEPLHLTGQRLHLRNVAGNEQVLHVIGQPAVIRDRGFDIEGNNIFLDRMKNRTWINGPGALRLPVRNDIEGRKLTTPSLLTIWWQEKMEFDGLTATFLNDVQAALNDSRLRCEEMQVVLTQRYSFSGQQPNAPQAEVRRVICKDGVEIDRSSYVEKELTEINRGQFATLTIDQKTGATEAVGPGEVAIWRPGRGKRAALAPRAVAQANRPLESDVANWEFTRVTFSGKTIGNMRERQTTFNDRVRIVYGPVAHPLDTIDPDNLPKDGGEMRCDKLEILQHPETSAQKNYIELRADGDAKLEGRSFYAQADSISFDESKELYTLRSKGNRQVTIWRQATPGGNYDEASAKSMRFIPSRNYLESDKTTGIRGSN